MKIYEYDLIDEKNKIRSVKRIEKHKSIWVGNYRIVFQDESWINLVGELSIGYERWICTKQVRYYSLYPLNERMIKTIRKTVIG